MSTLKIAFLVLFSLIITFRVSAESVCVGGPPMSREQLEGRISYSVFDDEIKVVFYLGEKQGDYKITHSEFFYGISDGIESYDGIIDKGYEIRLPMEFEVRNGWLHSRVYVKKKFKSFAVILKLAGSPDCEQVNYCPQDVIIKVLPSDIDYSSRRGDL